MNSKTTKLGLYIIISFLIFIFGVFFSELTENLQPLIISFCFFYVITVLCTIKEFGLVSLYSVYIYTSAFFMYDCLLLTLIYPDKNFLEQSFPIRYVFSEYVGKIFIICCFLASFTSHISYLLYRNSNKPSVVSYGYNINLCKISLIIFFVELFPLIYKIYLQLLFVRNQGFSAIYTKAFLEMKYPIWCAGAFFIFNSSYYLFLTSNPSRKKFIVITTIYTMIALFNGLKGGRGSIIGLLIVTIFLFSKKFNFKFNLTKLISFAILIFILIAFLTNIRKSYEKDNDAAVTSKIKVSKVIEEILWDQTTSRAVPLLIIRGGLDNHPYPFVFSPFTSKITSYIYQYAPATKESIRYSNDPSIVLISNVQMYAALTGRGYGSAFLGEAYECFGYIGIIFFYSLLSCVIGYLDLNGINVKPIYVPICYSLITTIPCSPRKEIFQFVKYNMNGIIVCYILFLFIHIFLYSVKGNKRECTNTIIL